MFPLPWRESIDHILIHCSKAKVSWELIFALFDVTRVLPLLVRETLFGWYGSFVGKKRQNVWKTTPLCIFWMVWKEINRIAFENEEFSIQRMKNSFVYSYWSWTKLFIDEGPLSLINFFYWLGTRWGWMSFFVSPLLFGLCFEVPLVYSLYALGWPMRA